jgi:8-oxo-dGTP pyrophosphatase MutT (NUDIX family)
MKQATICYIVRDDQILLGMKKLRFGAGKWNGFGGKVDQGETLHESAAREVFEESGIATSPDSLIYCADIMFYFGESPMFQCHVFIAKEWHGEAHESDEMMPQWFPIHDLPLRDMWASDAIFLPRILAGERLKGTMRFDDAGKHVVATELETQPHLH